MRFFLILFLLFSSFPLKAELLGLGRGDMSQFDLTAFIANTDQEIEERRFLFDDELDGKARSMGHFALRMRVDKSDLIEIEKYLYKLKKERALDPASLRSAKAALAKHQENIADMKKQIRIYAGLTGEEAEIELDRDAKKFYYSGAWELYKSDHQLVFDLIEKTDENFYRAFKGNDEEYIGFITGYVEPYIEQSRESAQGLLQFSGKVFFSPSRLQSLLYSQSESDISQKPGYV